MMLPILLGFGVAELDDCLFYPVVVQRTEYLLAVPLVERGEYLCYLTAWDAELRCQEECERVTARMQSQWEMLGPYFPGWESDTCFIEAVTGQELSVSLGSHAGSVRAGVTGYVCPYGTYHIVPDGQGETEDEAISQLADHVSDVDRECRHLCWRSRYRLSQGQNLLYPMLRSTCWAMVWMWLRLIILLASLVLGSLGLRYAWLQMYHIM